VPIEKTAYKELRKARKRHLRNISIGSELKTLKKNFERLIVAKKLDDAKSALKNLVSKIDRAASKGVLKTNAASRSISRLMKKLSKSK
jgi:small subunit ribosomal protein S20